MSDYNNYGYGYDYNYDYTEQDYYQQNYEDGQEERHGMFHSVNFNGLDFSVDEYGRVVDPDRLLSQDPNLPEDFDSFLSGWQKQRLASTLDAVEASRCVWPNEPVVQMCRFDLFECDHPLSQYGTINITESRRIRKEGVFHPLLTVFFFVHSTQMSRVIELETATPPLRSRFRPATERNRRDICTWVGVERMNAFVESNGIPGTQEYYIDWTDGPDRYLMSSSQEPRPGWRRLWHFAGYPVSQYYIIERDIEHPVLTGEGGKSKAYSIVKGLSVFARKNWRLIGSFFAFDKYVPSSNKYTVYTREDPFHRMVVTMDAIDHAHEWNEQFSFYAFDIPIPGSCVYELHHCVRSIHTTDASVGRHRLTTENSKLPWQFRMYVYVYPALPEDCTITDVCDNYLENPYVLNHSDQNYADV